MSLLADASGSAVACPPPHDEASRAFAVAEKLAQQQGHSLSTGHVLLALFDFANAAQVLFDERKVARRELAARLDGAAQEAPQAVRRLRLRAEQVAEQAEAEGLDCLHLLVAITRMRHSVAYAMLQRLPGVAGNALTGLRNVAVSYITGTMPRRFRIESPPALRRAPALPRSEPPEAPPVDQPAIPLPEAAAPPGRAPQPAGERRDSELQAASVDLLAEAAAGRLDRAVGRDAEMQALVDVLGKRRANNPVLVGPPGVGKTAIVEGLAVKIARRDADVADLFDCRLLALDSGALLAGTSLRGALSERLQAIKAEVAAAERRIIVFIDELHVLLGGHAGGDAAQDAADELKAALARGEFPCIGATTEAEYRRSIGKDPALERRFSRIDVAEPDCETARAIVGGSILPYARHHRLRFTPEAVEAAVRLTHQFIDGQQLPDKAFAALDLAGSRTRRRGASEVGRGDVAEVVSLWSGVPQSRLLEADAQRLLGLEAFLQEQVVGHRAIIAKVAHAVRRGFAGFGDRRPLSSMLLLGPTGVGKTEMCRALAHFMFGRRDAMLRLDMSEMSERHSVARLVGAQPGYVGFDEGGQLTEALRRRPFQLVLFDEIDKAHPDVLNLLLQILDEGSLTDSRGEAVSFRHTLVLLTTNLGAQSVAAGRLGFAGQGGGGVASEDALELARNAMLAAAQAKLLPELWGRLDEHLAFLPLTPDDIVAIAAAQLQRWAERLQAQRGLTLRWTPDVPTFLMQVQRSASASGARGLRQAMARLVEAPVAEWILRGDAAGAQEIWLQPGDDTLEVSPRSA